MSQSAGKREFLSGDYLAAEVASPSIERRRPRMYCLRLVGLTVVRHEVRFSHHGKRRSLGPRVILTVRVGVYPRSSSPQSDSEVLQFSLLLWPWCGEPAADPAAWLRFLGQYSETRRIPAGSDCRPLR